MGLWRTASLFKHSAFLTPRTIFIQIFDASKPLMSKYLEGWRHEGHSYAEKRQDITILQLMIQWMQYFCTSMVEKKEGTPANECPIVMIVGSHGDKVKLEDQCLLLNELTSSC